MSVDEPVLQKNTPKPLVRKLSSFLSSDPKSIITTFMVRTTIEKHKGSGTKLISWDIKDFTKPGDNFGALVTSLHVKLIANNVEESVSYVVKINNGAKEFADVYHEVFCRESMFFMEIAPRFSATLESARQAPLRMPKCYFFSAEKGREVIICEDLRMRGFKMADRQKGLDVAHSVLVLKELARLHASSYVIQENNPSERLLRTYPLLKPEIFEIFEVMIRDSIDMVVDILKFIEGHDQTINWLTEQKPGIVDRFRAKFKDNKKSFRALCHGDCWVNNILFRYGERGRPVEVMFVDLQGASMTSVVTDLHYFLRTSLNGSIYPFMMKDFSKIYLDAYKNVLDASKVPLPFTEKELEEEFQDKTLLGLIALITVVPTIILEFSDTETIDLTDYDNAKQKIRDKMMGSINGNPFVEPRLLAVLKELRDLST